MKFGRIVLPVHVNMHQLMKPDFWHDIIHSRRQPWRQPTTCWHAAASVSCLLAYIRQLLASPPSACNIIDLL